MEPPETRYATTPDGLRIAYQVLGDGPTDVVFLPYTSCVDVMWEDPTFARVLHRFADIGRLICLDARGLGASDPVPLGALPTPEAWMEDIRVVLDTVESTTAGIVTSGWFGFMGMLFAATYPDRTNALILIETSAQRVASDEHASAGMMTLEGLEALAQAFEQTWGTGAIGQLLTPSRAGDESFRRWQARYERGAGSPATVAALVRWFSSFDLRDVLPTIRVPTLVIWPADAIAMPVDRGRSFAQQIAGAELSVVPGSEGLLFTESADEVVDLIVEFITGAPPVREPDRALTTVLFTDIVASTDHASRIGDKRWTQLLNQHDAFVERELERYRGRKVNPTGDGMLATFDGPARAVRCAQAIVDAVRPLGLELRAGLHTGEVELRGPDIGGIAVHIGQRVSALAGPGEVLVSRTITDLVAGSGLEFEDRGDHELKGVPGRWRIYAVMS